LLDQKGTANLADPDQKRKGPPTMKRATAVLASAFVTVLVTAGAAIAQSYPPGSPKPTTAVEGTSGQAGAAPTAFTGGGSDLSFGLAAGALLLAVGVVALLIARRRAARLVG
jgi:hypothetical protein